MLLLRDQASLENQWNAKEEFEQKGMKLTKEIQRSDACAQLNRVINFGVAKNRESASRFRVTGNSSAAVNFA
jgi:hypothetical protein